MELEGALEVIIAECGNKEYVHKTILTNAAPYLFAFIYYPWMPPHIYVNPTGSFPIFASSLSPYVCHLSS